MEYKYSNVHDAVKSRIRAAMANQGMTISALARRSGRRKEALRRLLNTRQSPRLDTLLAICSVLKISPARLFREDSRSSTPDISDWALPLTQITRWDDRLSSPAERRARLEGGERHRYIATILEDIPPDEYWTRLDLAGLRAEYKLVRPGLRRTRPFFDQILSYREDVAA